MKTQQSLALIFCGLTLFSGLSMAEDKMPKVDPDLDAMKTVKICVDYYYLKSDAEKARYKKELDRRAMLSQKDYDNFNNKIVETGSTMCGMYMSLGRPLTEKGKQLRPLVFKVVHVYPSNYYVTQMGIVVGKYERKPGSLPPQLSADTPTVEPPPVMMHAPGGTPSHH